MSDSREHLDFALIVAPAGDVSCYLTVGSGYRASCPNACERQERLVADGVPELLKQRATRASHMVGRGCIRFAGLVNVVVAMEGSKLRRMVLLGVRNGRVQEEPVGAGLGIGCRMGGVSIVAAGTLFAARGLDPYANLMSAACLVQRGATPGRDRGRARSHGPHHRDG